MQTISSGTTVSSTTGTDTNDIVQNGGTLIVEPGAGAIGTNVSGFLVDSGTTTGTIVSSGGQEQVAFGGAASGTSILSAGAETVLAGGTIFNGTVGPGGYMGLGYDPGNAPPVAGGTA